MAGKSTVILDQHGSMHINESGFTGTACAERTEQLLRGLKHKTEDEDKTAEFYARERIGERGVIGR